MAMDRGELLGVMHELVLPDAKAKWSKNNLLRNQIAGDVTRVWTPSGVDSEYKDFMRKARSPWLQYAAQCIAQGLVVDGHTNTELWEKGWEGTGMGGRQSALTEQVVSYGYGYLLSFPSDQGDVFMRPLSVHKTFSTFADPWDDQPEYVIHQVKGGRDKEKQFHRFFDDEAMYEVYGDPERPDKVTVVPHELEMNPVSLIKSQYALDGLPSSIIEPALPVYHRVVDATFTLLMVQRYGAFPQKHQSGGVIATDEAGNALIRPSVDSILHSDDPETRFGNFAAADLDKVVAAKDAHLQDLAAILQIPPHYFLGKVVNLSSDAVAAIETGYHRRNGLLKESMGEGLEQSLRVAAAVLKMDDAAKDMSASVHWSGTEVWSLAEVADAAVKLNSIGAPREMILQMIPGWSQEDAQSAAKVAIVRDRTELSSTNIPAPRGDAGTTTANTSGTTE